MQSGRGVGGPGTVSAVAVKMSPAAPHRARLTSHWSRPRQWQSVLHVHRLWRGGSPRALGVHSKSDAMLIRKSVQLNWHERESGLIVLEGTTSDLSYYSSQTYLQIKEKALAIE